MRILFVGEQRSQTAIERGWRWQDGRLAAKTLFDALAGVGISGADHDFVNLWNDGADMVVEAVTDYRRAALRREVRSGRVVVALGAKVSAGLAAIGVAHRALIHPAARGRIRGRARYAAHVASVLSDVARAIEVAA